MYVRERTDCAGYASDAARSDYAFEEFGRDNLRAMPSQSGNDSSVNGRSLRIRTTAHEEVSMNIFSFSRKAWLPVSAALIFAMCAFGTYSSTAVAAGVKVTLAGDQEVPPVKSAGSGSGWITVGADKSVSGSVTTTGITGTAAHVHEAAAGKNGPVIIALTKDGDTYTVPAGAKLSDAQYASFQAGNLYVNVHTTANAGGEMRGQLKP
jgi:hypothetical protein